MQRLRRPPLRRLSTVRPSLSRSLARNTGPIHRAWSSHIPCLYSGCRQRHTRTTLAACPMLPESCWSSHGTNGEAELRARNRSEIVGFPSLHFQDSNIASQVIRLHLGALHPYPPISFTLQYRLSDHDRSQATCQLGHRRRSETIPRPRQRVSMPQQWFRCSRLQRGH